ncbi:MAG: livF1 [Clostridiaceae bacterium]|nr:livF1 [Clostridiaceae bacterium]
MLNVENLNVCYGGIEALKDVSFKVEKGKLVTLVGANGAGKSTILRSIMGLVKPQSGKIDYKGLDLKSVKTKDMVNIGITLVPEGRRVFSNLTVLENLKIGAYSRTDTKEIQKDIEWVYSLFPRLKERNWQLTGTLSGGEQQMVAIGRALMSKPELIMMDEPSLGLAPIIVKELFGIIKQINKDGVTVLLIEQNATSALKIADIGYVIETGNIILNGSGQELLKNDQVKKAYLGEEI